MNIDPKIEPWLIALLDGVQNSNHRAETTATTAYAVPALVKALGDCTERLRACCVSSGCDPEYADIAVEKYRAALVLARGETP